MAHEIESMFFVGETPWHGLGQRVDSEITTGEAIKKAGLDWSVRTEPVYCKLDRGIVGLDGQPIRQETKAPAQAVVRDNGTVLGVVGERYHPLQNTDAFGFFDKFIEAGEVNLETAGSLQDGRKIWVLARVKDGDRPVIGDDIVRSYIMLSNSHDGTTAVRVGFTPVRIVCANTLAAAHNSSNSALIRVKHTASVKFNLDLIRDTMNTARRSFEANADQYAMLARKEISQKDVLAYIQKVFDVEGKSPDEISPRMRNQIDKVLYLAEYGRGQRELKGMTLWKLYNGMTEFLTHQVTDDADRRYASLWFGANADKNKKALETALTMVA